jgi:cytochrome c-type biogenesis protein CcmH
MPARRPSWRHIVLALACWGTLVVSHSALAVQPDEVLADANLEARARALSRELRCMVCQNQSIDDSDAPLARDLRVLVRERLTKGDSDEQVIGFLVSRYGEFVLLKPPFEWHTAILWLTPLFAVLAGVIAMFAAIRRRRVSTSPPLPLDADEERRLREVLDKSG